MHEHTVTVTYLNEAIDALDAANGEPMTPIERIAFWLDLAASLRALQVVVGQAAGSAAVAVAEENARLGAKPREDYWLPDGRAVHLAAASVRYRWQGYSLLERLVEEVVTREGEYIRALPIDRALRYLSACQEEVSSGWRVTGLTNEVPDWQKYRERHEDPDTIRAGARSEWGA